ncbi:hypothetical protein VT84_03945 [Gemmata sp. SH-PL17]|uniref:Gmad2 immunoglobulin-like domain-containing protein n=1 Tax=Gemmata sp. SH-PL17 TaxID=1630693 RepID=UPI00078E0904|nr:hypothetical protein VT84_03945 [Gemmata sp. SH-PL17]
MPTPWITISQPTNGATVARSFTVSGKCEATVTSSQISVVLKDSGGATVATGALVTAVSGDWYSNISATQAYTGASVVATVSGTASDSVGSLTVS